MRLPLAGTGVPFRDTKMVVDLRDNPDAETAFVTIYARGDGEGVGTLVGTVNASLLTSEETIALPTCTFKGNQRPERVVLERFPVLAGCALEIAAGLNVVCYGFVELHPVDEVAQSEALIEGEQPEGASELPGVVILAVKKVVHVLSDLIDHELTLFCDVPANAQCDLIFYEEDQAVSLLHLRGPLHALSLFERIPMRGPGRIEAMLVDLIGDVNAVVYGLVARR